MLQGHKQSGLVTLVERRSGYLLAGRLERFTASQTTNTLIRLLKPIRGAAKTLAAATVLSQRDELRQAVSNTHQRGG